MERFAFLTTSGLAQGAVLAAFALALVLIHRATRVVNFAQGALALAAAYIASTVVDRTGSWWLGLVVAVVAGVVLAVVVEVAVMRRIGPRDHLRAVIASLGVVMVTQAVLGVAFGPRVRPAPAPLSQNALVAGLSPYALFTLVAVAVLLVAVALLLTRTRVGLRLRAAALAPTTARLLGVPVARLVTLGWALAGGVGAVAAMLVLPTGAGLSPTALDLVFISAFTAAVVGGLDSPPGAVVGGLAVGLVLSYATGYAANPNVAPVAVLGLLLVVLLARPGGLFAAAPARRA